MNQEKRRYILKRKEVKDFALVLSIELYPVQMPRLYHAPFLIWKNDMPVILCQRNPSDVSSELGKFIRNGDLQKALGESEHFRSGQECLESGCCGGWHQVASIPRGLVERPP